jgi:hypothetical protein
VPLFYRLTAQEIAGIKPDSLNFIPRTAKEDWGVRGSLASKQTAR